jgi:hypothetical protein
MLTHGDIEDLKAFFHSPLAAGYRDTIAAQSYEPRGIGYDPSTDVRLARLVFEGVRHGRGDWSRMKRIVDHLSDAHVEVLRLVCCHGGESAIACRTPRALAAGRKLAVERHRVDYLEHVESYARRNGLSPIAVAVKVLEADRTFHFDAGQLSVLALLASAHRAIEEGLVDVEAETQAIVTAAADAYHAARTLMAEWKRATARREDARRSDFRAELADKREARRSARASQHPILGRLRAAS